MLDTHLVCLVVAGILVLAIAANADDAGKSMFRKPSPKGVIEVKGIGADGGMVGLKDGTLMLANGSGVPEGMGARAQYRVSSDGGGTWSDPDTLETKIGIGGMIRLQSGELAIYGGKATPEGRLNGYHFSKSADEGKTWSEPTLISDYPNFTPMFRSMIQLKSGRLLLAGYWEGLSAWDDTMVCVHPELQYLDVSAYGMWRGKKVQIEGHGHAPEMGMSMVYRSDDEGKTWKKHPGALMGWFDTNGVVNGATGMTPCFEPTIVETKDGHVLFVARSTVGRLVYSFSTNGSENWYGVKPMALCSSESPGMLAILPRDGDLLLVWNQVSPEEIRRGYRRGRLSAAISSDGGHSWRNFKTIELSDGLEDIDRLQPEYPIQPVRARDFVGALPDAWAYFHYSNVDVVGDKVFIRYSRGTPLLGVAEQDLNKQEAVLRVYPVSWFYE